MAARLHLVSFDVPWPADYGGIIDVYHTCRTLTRLGAEVVLHAYQYGRPDAPQVHEVAAEVHYYPRDPKQGLFGWRMPHVVASRNAPALLERLLADPAPILYHGLHTTATLVHPGLKDRVRVVRMHNIEHDYYRELARREDNPLRKAYDRIEAIRLERYESVLRQATWIAAVSEGDVRSLDSRFPGKVTQVASFHPFDDLSTMPGQGGYAFYHGNFGVSENRRAAEWLIRKVFASLDVSLVIAGRSPSGRMRRLAAPYPWIRIVADPDPMTMDTLLRDAQVVVLPTFQPTGLKLKLLNSVFAGRHVLVTPEMVQGSGLASLCTLAATPAAFREAVLRLMGEPFTRDMKEARRSILVPRFDNAANGRKMLGLLGLSG